MPLRINGHNFSWTALTSTVAVIFWLAGLSWQVKANGDEIQKQSETKERLVRIEERQETFKEDLTEVKEGQKEASDTARKIEIKIAEILTELKKDE